MNHQLHICLALILLSFTAVCATAQERIPFRLEGNLLIIKATLNGQTGNFILDTGAPELIVNERYFEGKCIYWDQKQIIDFNGHASEALHFAITKFSIGALTIKKQYALTVDLTSVEKVKGVHLLGIIGYSVLKDLELHFDFDKQELSIAPSQKKSFVFASDEPPSATFDLRFSGHIPFLTLRIHKKKLRFGLDTGAEVNLLDDRSLKHAEDGFDEVKKLQVKGISYHQKAAVSGILHHLYIDGNPVGPMNVTVISLQPLNENLAIRLDGVLGMPFFKQGKVMINYEKRKMWVWPSDGRLVEEDIEAGLEVQVDKGNK